MVFIFCTTCDLVFCQIKPSLSVGKVGGKQMCKNFLIKDGEILLTLSLDLLGQGSNPFAIPRRLLLPRSIILSILVRILIFHIDGTIIIVKLRWLLGWAPLLLLSLGWGIGAFWGLFADQGLGRY